MSNKASSPDFTIKSSALRAAVQLEVVRLAEQQKQSLSQSRSRFFRQPLYAMILSLLPFAALFLLNSSTFYFWGVGIFYIAAVFFCASNLSLSLFCSFRVDKPSALTNKALIQLQSLSNYIDTLEQLQKNSQGAEISDQAQDEIIAQLQRRYDSISSVLLMLKSLSV